MKVTKSGWSTREAPPQTAEVAADLDFPLTDLHMSVLTQGPAVMIGRPPPPAAPKSGRYATGRATPKWLVRTLPAELWSGRPRRYAARKLRTSVKVFGTEDP
jgi:hypothetical protein